MGTGAKTRGVRRTISGEKTSQAGVARNSSKRPMTKTNIGEKEGKQNQEAVDWGGSGPKIVGSLSKTKREERRTLGEGKQSSKNAPWVVCKGKIKEVKKACQKLRGPRRKYSKPLPHATEVPGKPKQFREQTAKNIVGREPARGPRAQWRSNSRRMAFRA